MSETTRGADGDSATPEPDSALTVEDAGTTTDPADLVDEDDAAPARASGGLDDDSIGHVFDQTNGVADGLAGDSDGTAESDELSRAERDQENPDFDDAEVRGDDDGVADVRDPNP